MEIKTEREEIYRFSPFFFFPNVLWPPAILE